MTRERQTADTVIVVRPCRFQSNPETADSNSFQAAAPLDDLDASNAMAQTQFDGVVERLRAAGVRCLQFDDTEQPHTPDSIFPNNWISTHADGTVVLYPMEAENRRTERRQDIVDALQDEHGFEIRQQIDLSSYERQGLYLEGTGSMVLDRVNAVAYACKSSRTNPTVLDEFCTRLGYQSFVFDSADADGQPIYHTNVMMFIAPGVAGVCLESVPSHQRDRLAASLRDGGYEVLELTFAQVCAFAGNMLALHNDQGETVIALSDQAHAALDAAQRDTLAANARLVICPIDHIERQSGGSVRCMLAEVHLPRAQR